MDPKTAHRWLLPATMELFPARFNSPEAQALILAIWLQESDMQHRRQLIGNHRMWWEVLIHMAPAKGYGQFEKIGIRGVLEHPASAEMARKVCEVLGYPPDVNTLHNAIENNDILCVAFSRLALWRLPRALPGPDDVHGAWAQYYLAWGPGKPKPERWAARYRLAWDIVRGIK